MPNLKKKLQLVNTIEPATLQERLALIQWRKSDNEQKMKETLVRCGEAKGLDSVQKSVSMMDQGKSQWIDKIIEDELKKKLEVNKEFVKKWTEKEIKDWKRENACRERIKLKVSKAQEDIINKEIHRITRKQVSQRRKMLEVVLQDNNVNQVESLATHKMYIDTAIAVHAPRPASELSVAKLATFKDEMDVRDSVAAVQACSNIDYLKACVRRKQQEGEEKL